MELALTVGGIRQAGSNIFFSEFRIVVESRFIHHSRGQPTEHVRDRNTHPANRWSPTALAGFVMMSCYTLYVVHHSLPALC